MKLENILLDENQNPKITDFGTCKVLEAGKTSTIKKIEAATFRLNIFYFLKKRFDNNILNENFDYIFRYASPEQLAIFEVETPSHISTKSDIWSMGAIIYELMSEMIPWRNSKSELAVY